MAVVLALASAVVYGAADFLGGLASRRASVFAVVALSQAAGLVALLLVLPWLGGPATGTDLAWGAAAGLAGSTGLMIFFRTLATGVMSVVAPTTAVTAAAVPVLVGVASGDRVGVPATVGIVLALGAVALVSAEQGLGALRSARPAALLPALLAGSAFGLFFVLLDQPAEESRLTPLVAARLSSVALVLVLAATARRSLRPPRSALPLIAVSGVGDMAANSLFLLATQAPGPLAVTGVLASLYPVSTVVLAQVVLRERLAGTQVAGLAVAVVAIVLITS
ncbi:EamA family transporter [Trujillonella endophytica]|uniref:EamA-like transporter family protein n=1 Tax=Trujillonella endophytica TaxID=673521 RepID=A0A1H8TTQ1_9ACTN|nr:EamA family transporter [Trujillella endophytica]SEO94225.1 EamA-like transporter family protein [Trujillella endophytica]